MQNLNSKVKNEYRNQINILNNIHYNKLTKKEKLIYNMLENLKNKEIKQFKKNKKGNFKTDKKLTQVLLKFPNLNL